MTLDTLFMFKRAMDNYVKTPSEKCYNDVLQAMVIVLKEEGSVWMAANIVEQDGQQVVKPGMLAGTDDMYYYIIGIEDTDIGQMDERLQKLEINFKVLLTKIADDETIGGICLNPWDGGCFIPRDHIKHVLGSVE